MGEELGRERRERRLWPVAVLATLAALAAPGSALAQKLRVGKAVGGAFPFVFVDIGARNGIFKKHGLDLEISAFGGGPRLVQAMTSDSIDIGLNAGMDLVLTVKGAPVRAVAAIASRPLDLGIVVRPDLPATSAADLKGRKISANSPTALTAWTVREVSRQQGWGPNGIEVVTMLSQAAWPLLKTREIDGISTDLGNGLMGEKRGAGKVLVRYNEIISDVHVYHVSATDRIIQSRPELVKAFVQAWIESIAFARANPESAAAVASEVTHHDADVMRTIFDSMLPLVIADGKFSATALERLSQSFVDLKLLDAAPDMKPLYTERFLPAN
jgi:NitT/TauT family transport system substrate-binding protein